MSIRGDLRHTHWQALYLYATLMSFMQIDKWYLKKAKQCLVYPFTSPGIVEYCRL